VPDFLGDILFNGIAQNAYKANVAYALQSDAAYRFDDQPHAARRYFHPKRSFQEPYQLRRDRLDDAGNQINDTPIIVVDNGAKDRVDRKRLLAGRVEGRAYRELNYGARFDKFTAYASAHQVSPRINARLAGAARYHPARGLLALFLPPPFELVGNETVSKFANNTGGGSTTLSDTPGAEQANYYDVGANRRSPMPSQSGSTPTTSSRTT